MKTHEKNLIVIVGPTAVGKTAIAIEVAKYFQTEVVSADSRQIFKELSIGTAKPQSHEMADVKHHFIDSHSIFQDYDAARYGDDALVVINNILETKPFAILCGGSGLYVHALLQGFDEIPEVPEEIEREVRQLYETSGITMLQDEVKSADPEVWEKIDKMNPHRLMRALAVKKATGVSILRFQKKIKREHPFNIVKIGLELPREEMYARIDNRMDEMIGNGLFEEAERFHDYRHLQALQTVGYREIFDHFDGQYDRDEAVRLLKRNSRRYAKRQLTWFKRDTEITWFSPHDLSSIITFIQSLTGHHVGK